MNPEVQAAIIKVAGEWSVIIAKTYQPKNQVEFTNDLISVFRDSYTAIATQIEKLA